MICSKKIPCHPYHLNKVLAFINEEGKKGNHLIKITRHHAYFKKEEKPIHYSMHFQAKYFKWFLFSKKDEIIYLNQFVIDESTNNNLITIGFVIQRYLLLAVLISLFLTLMNYHLFPFISIYGLLFPLSFLLLSLYLFIYPLCIYLLNKKNGYFFHRPWIGKVIVCLFISTSFYASYLYYLAYTNNSDNHSTLNIQNYLKDKKVLSKSIKHIQLGDILYSHHEGNEDYVYISNHQKSTLHVHYYKEESISTDLLNYRASLFLDGKQYTGKKYANYILYQFTENNKEVSLFLSKSSLIYLEINTNDLIDVKKLIG